MLHELFLKLHGEAQNSLLGLSLNSVEDVRSLITSTVKGAKYAKSAKLAIKSTSTPMKIATFQFLSKAGKFTMVADAGLLRQVFYAGLSIKEACDMSAKLKAIKKLPKKEQAKAANDLAKAIMEEAERIEEEVCRLFKDFDEQGNKGY